MMISLSRMKRGDPTATFAIWSRSATRSFWVEGDYSAALIQTHISTEVLLDSVLLLLAWEEGRDPAEAAEWFESHLAKRVRTYYHPRLFGNWDTTQTSAPVGRWSNAIRLPRNRIVHSGYWASRHEAQEALEASMGLEQFVKDQLALARNQYPRTALIVLGTPGLTKRGLLKGKIKKFVDEVAGREPDWIRSFATWSERFESERANR